MTRTRLLAVAAAGTLMVALGGTGAASAGDGINVSGTALAVNQIGYSKNIEHLSNTPAVGPFANFGAYGTDIAFQDDRALSRKVVSRNTSPVDNGSLSPSCRATCWPA